MHSTTTHLEADPRHDTPRRSGRGRVRLALAGIAVVGATMLGLLAAGASDAGAVGAVGTTSLDVERDGDRVATTLTLESRARVHVMIATTPLPDGVAYYEDAGLGDRVVHSAVSPEPTTAWSAVHATVDPGRGHWVQVYARSADGGWWQVVRNHVVGR